MSGGPNPPCPSYGSHVHMDRAAYFRYAGENARNVVFPLGGIGAG
jgi:hypothetical protein